MRTYNIGGSRCNLTKYLPGDVAHSRGDNVSTNFTRGAPYNIWKGKKRPKFSAIFKNFRLWSQISPDQINISKIGKVLDQLQFILYWAKKIGELWCTNQKVIGAQPTELFSGFYITAPANTTNRVESPPKNFKGEHLKLGLKFNICAPMTLGVVGITSRNFTRRCRS